MARMSSATRSEKSSQDPTQSAAPGRLAGKRAIVTGAASGIGRASALRFAQEGARVLIVDREESALTQVQKDIEAAGGCAVAIPGDAGSEDDVRSWVKRCKEEWGGLEIAFANAGVSGGYVPLGDQTTELWQEILRINLLGPFLLIKHAAKLIRKSGGGSIIATSSVAGLRARAGSSPYSASKAGLISLVQTAANELSGANVRVNAVCPGLIETGMTAPLFTYARSQGRDDRLGSLTPAQRAGTADDIAHVVVFLASDESGYINGQAIAVDGGLTSTHPFRPMNQYRSQSSAE